MLKRRNKKYCSKECVRKSQITYNDIPENITGKERKKLRHKKYWNKWYHKNEENKNSHKNRVKINNKKRTEDIRKLFEEKKKECIICGEDEYCCLDFHHKNPEEKEFTLSSEINSGRKKEDIIKEINKCIVVCSNCHRKIHAGIID